jgi:hypothetical protein
VSNQFLFQNLCRGAGSTYAAPADEGFML